MANNGWFQWQHTNEIDFFPSLSIHAVDDTFFFYFFFCRWYSIMSRAMAKENDNRGQQMNNNDIKCERRKFIESKINDSQAISHGIDKRHWNCIEMMRSTSSKGCSFGVFPFFFFEFESIWVDLRRIEFDWMSMWAVWKKWRARPKEVYISHAAMGSNNLMDRQHKRVWMKHIWCIASIAQRHWFSNFILIICYNYCTQ